MNSDKAAIGYTNHSVDCFNTPLDQNGKSILTGMSKGTSNPDCYFKLVALETYQVEYY